MIIIYKNKGFFVLLYTVVFLIGVLFLGGYLGEEVGGLFAENYSKMILYGIACILSGICTLITDRYTFANGKLVRDEFAWNEFFYVGMKNCGYALIVFGIANIVVGILES